MVFRANSDPTKRGAYDTEFGVHDTQQNEAATSMFNGPVTNQPRITPFNQQQIDAMTMGFFNLKNTNDPEANETPVFMQCPSCRDHITTNTCHTTGSCTWIWCITFVWFLPLCILPFFMKCSKDVIHTCPRCKAICGRFNRFKEENRVTSYGGHPNMAAAYQTPVQMQCPSCRAQITSKIKFETGSCTWYWCIIFAASVGGIPFSFLPFCFSCTKDIVHTCPHCMAVCGRYDRHINNGRHGCCAIQQRY